ncbi:MAG: hypothetical protein LBQ79_06560 [Deltaproteobacteria bacterium]|jgi:hypothetical protein|nr:hypothetical protein [Deltaproteobacteria bacterium]
MPLRVGPGLFSSESPGEGGVLSDPRAQLETAVLAYYRYKVSARLFCTGLFVPGSGGLVRDVAVIGRDGELIEIEVSATLDELRRAFLKPKHGMYSRPPLGMAGFVPNRFLFAVPASVAASGALSAVRELDGSGKYGVLAVTLPTRLKRQPGEPFWFTGSGSGDVRTAKRPGVLSDRGLDTPHLRRLMEMRLLEELVSQRHMTENFRLPEYASAGGARAPEARSQESAPGGGDACGVGGRAGTPARGHGESPGSPGVSPDAVTSGSAGKPSPAGGKASPHGSAVSGKPGMSGSGARTGSESREVSGKSDASGSGANASSGKSGAPDAGANASGGSSGVPDLDPRQAGGLKGGRLVRERDGWSWIPPEPGDA